MPSSLANPRSESSKKTPAERYRELLAEGVLSADPAQQALIGTLDALQARILRERRSWFARRFSAPGKSGLYIWGDVGRGKSMLMDLFYASLSGEAERLHFHAFMQRIHRDLFELRRDRPGLEDPLLHVAGTIAGETRVLCFDEFQVTDIADAMLLSRLFEQLFARGVIVVFTSNRAPEKLYENGLQRERFLPFIALLRERTEIFELSAREDYRLTKMAALDHVYHTPLGPDAERFVADTLHTLACDQGEPRELTVQGRRLVVPYACRDVARFRFRDLCEMPLSAGDYLELAAQFRTFFVTDIPKLSRERRDAAKRFVTLIDVLYEARAKLIVTAETPPEGLYPAGDGSFEFHRTVSRLTEMQSAEYLAASQSVVAGVP